MIKKKKGERKKQVKPRKDILTHKGLLLTFNSAEKSLLAGLKSLHILQSWSETIS